MSWVPALSRWFMKVRAVMRSGRWMPLTRSRTRGTRNVHKRLGGSPRLRDQHLHIRGSRVLLPEGWRRLPPETTVRSGRRTAGHAIDLSSPLQALQTPTPARSLDLQILQRTLQVLSLSLLSTVHLCPKSLMFATSNHLVVVRHYPCHALVV